MTDEEKKNFVKSTILFHDSKRITEVMLRYFAIKPAKKISRKEIKDHVKDTIDQYKNTLIDLENHDKSVILTPEEIFG